MSALKVNTIQDASGNNGTTPALLYNGTAKAWVNFNGTGTPAIRASYNVTSITDNGVGDYTVNFTNALADANFSVSGIAGKTAGKNSFVEPLPDTTPTFTTTSVRIGVYQVVTTAGLSDESVVVVQVVR